MADSQTTQSLAAAVGVPDDRAILGPSGIFRPATAAAFKVWTSKTYSPTRLLIRKGGEYTLLTGLSPLFLKHPVRAILCISVHLCLLYPHRRVPAASSHSATPRRLVTTEVTFTLEGVPL
jgi:hypothetical protein